MIDKWIKLEDVVFDNSINVIHCDTRDFHCNIVKDNDIIPVQLTSGFEFTIDRVKEIILSLKENSGGEGSWRMITFENDKKDHTGWDWKYIRIFKTRSGNYGISPRSQTQFVKKDFFKYHKICQEHLHHINK